MSDSDGPRKRVIVIEVIVALKPVQVPSQPVSQELGQTTSEGTW